MITRGDQNLIGKKIYDSINTYMCNISCIMWIYLTLINLTWCNQGFLTVSFYRKHIILAYDLYHIPCFEIQKDIANIPYNQTI